MINISVKWNLFISMCVKFLGNFDYISLSHTQTQTEAHGSDFNVIKLNNSYGKGVKEVMAKCELWHNWDTSHLDVRFK